MPPGGERRQVTILFADISGYTRLSSEIDPEELHALLERYFHRVDGLVRDFGGTVDKHIGDAVMGVFGAPVSHGNDAERAVRAALAIHDAMEPLSAELGRALTVHIGVANGEVVAGASGSDVHREYTVLGDAVNLASRLDGVARGGETVISAGVQRAVARLVESESAGEVTVKGLAEPVRVYKVRAIVRQKPRFHTPLVGRDDEVASFDRVVARTVESGRGAVVYLRGEPGVGKTRLVAEMCDRAGRRGFESHQGLVLDFGTGRGDDAIRSLVKSAMGLPVEATPSEREFSVNAMEREGSFSGDDIACLDVLLDLPLPPALRSRYEVLSEEMRSTSRGEVVARVFERASRRAPALVVVEDVHWADAGTLADLSALARRAQGAPIVVLITSRAEGDPLGEAWRARAGDIAVTRLDLLPLRPHDIERLAASIGAPDSRRLRACVERSGGNPLFLEQLLSSEAEGALPDSVQSLVQARMDRLLPLDKRALQAAAVIGQRFTLDLLRHLMGAPDYSIETLVERSLVRPVGDSWLFAHALVRDGAYSSLLKQARRELHRRAATWFGTSDLTLRAEHLDRAEDPAAPGAYAAAANERIEALDYERALTLLRRGSELATSADDVFQLAQHEGELMLYRADAAGAVAAFERARDNATTDKQRCRACAGLADAHRIVQAVGPADEALDQALSFGGEPGMDAELSRIHRIRGSLRFVTGKDGHEEQELALEHAVRAGNVELEARALSCLGDAYYLMGRSRQANEYFARSVELCRRHGLGRVELYQHYMVGIVRMFMGDLHGGLHATEIGVEQASRAGHRRAEMIARESKALIHIQLGQYEEALGEITLALELARATRSRMFEGMLLAERGDALAMLGRMEQARATLAELASLDSISGFWLVAPLQRALEAWFVADEAAAEESRKTVSRELNELPRALVAMFFHARAADVCLARGFDRVAEAHATDALALSVDSALIDHLAHRVLALVAYKKGSRTPELLARLAALRSEADRMGVGTSIGPFSSK